jgi:hypothetical protein
LKIEDTVDTTLSFEKRLVDVKDLNISWIPFEALYKEHEDAIQSTYRLENSFYNSSFLFSFGSRCQID